MARISVLQNTLGQLRLANIATLDAITTHFTRLIDLTSADEPYISSLANNLAPCILRPRTDTSLTMHERHSYRLVRDLFDHKEPIFGELKRASTLSHTPSGGANSAAARIRAISTDESNRRANMEARNRAIASKSRNSSPAPPVNGRGHRRDKSVDPPATRFPIQTGPIEQRKVVARASLEVPGSPAIEKNDSNHTGSVGNTVPITEHSPQDHNANHENNNTPGQDPSSDDVGVTSTFAEKRESLGRSSRFPPRKTGTAGSLSRSAAGTRSSLEVESGERHSVQLSDRPMDD